MLPTNNLTAKRPMPASVAILIIKTATALNINNKVSAPNIKAILAETGANNQQTSNLLITKLPHIPDRPAIPNSSLAINQPTNHTNKKRVQPKH